MMEWVSGMRFIAFVISTGIPFFFVRIVVVLHLFGIHCVMPVFSPLYPLAAAEYGRSHGMFILYWLRFLFYLGLHGIVSVC